MNVFTLDVAPTNVSTTNVCDSQSPGAGVILINGTLASGGVATCGAAQILKISTAGDESTRSFTVTGTDENGDAQSETVSSISVGSNKDTTKYYKTITEITHTGTLVGAISVGTTVGSLSSAFKFYKQVSPARIAVGISLVSGTSTYTLQDCFTNAPHTLWMDNATVTSKTASFEYAYIDTPCMAARLKVTASSTGVLQANFVIARA